MRAKWLKQVALKLALVLVVFGAMAVFLSLQKHGPPPPEKQVKLERGDSLIKVFDLARKGIKPGSTLSLGTPRRRLALLICAKEEPASVEVTVNGKQASGHFTTTALSVTPDGKLSDKHPQKLTDASWYLLSLPDAIPLSGLNMVTVKNEGSEPFEIVADPVTEKARPALPPSTEPASKRTQPLSKTDSSPEAEASAKSEEAGGAELEPGLTSDPEASAVRRAATPKRLDKVRSRVRLRMVVLDGTEGSNNGG